MKNDSSKFIYYGSKIMSLLPIILLVCSIFIVRKLLLEYTLDELMYDLQSISAWHIFIAVILTILNYIVLTFYDYLGTRYVNSRIPMNKVAVVSFIAYSFSQNLGVSMLSGGAIRYRFYTKEGISSVDVAKIIAFAGFHFWLGLFFLTGILSLSFPEVYAGVFHTHEYVFRLIGAATLLPSLFYILVVFYPGILNTKLRKYIPSKVLGLSGLAVCVFDWFLASNVFFVMLHGDHEITLLKTIIAFTGAQSLGVVSHVPGGLGVFEATVAYLLSPDHDNSRLISSLIAFRIIYYIVPFILSSVMLLSTEIVSHASALKNTSFISPTIKSIGNIFLSLAPLINSYITVGTGIFLSFSLNLFSTDISFISMYIPTSGMIHEFSVFFCSVLALMLCVVGIGLRRRIRYSWNLAVVMLAALLLISFAGINATRTYFIAANVLFLLLTKKAFYRTRSFLESFEKSTILWVLGIVWSILIYGLFVFEKEGPVSEQWWLYTVDTSYSRFMRSTIATFIFYLLFGFYIVYKKSESHTFTKPSPQDLNIISDIINTTNSTHAYLGYAADKEFLFSENKDSFLMWRESGLSFIAFGDPVGKDENFSSLLWNFRELSYNFSKICVLYEISSNTIPLAMDVGLKVFKIGEEGIVDLKAFTLKGSKSSQFRNVISRMQKENITFRVLEKSEVPHRMDELREVSDDWLKHKNSSEKSFSLGAFDPEYLIHFRFGVVEQSGKILAFANLLESGLKEELSIDLMRHRKLSPNGIMDYLFVSLFEWGRDNGYGLFNLGMAPLSGLSRNPLSPNYAKLGNLIYYHGSHFYNFDGLRRYKNKFNPTWRPKYLACSNSYLLAVVLSNISLLISGGFKKLITK